MVITLQRSISLLFLAQCMWLSFSADSYDSKCEFPQRGDHEAFEILKKVEGLRYSTSDGDYDYYVGICTRALKTADSGTVGAVQVKRKKKGAEEQRWNLGNFDEADFVKGNDWISLTYTNGTTYGSTDHCSKSPRTAQIMIACDKGNTKGTFDIVDENKDRVSNCYYLFELRHDAVCPKESHKKSLSTGSIICIVFVSVALVYLILGVIIQRAVRGKQSWEQLPNYTFWKAVGNYAADGCDLVFRSSDSGSRAYNDMSGSNHTQDIPRDDPDDHILSM